MRLPFVILHKPRQQTIPEAGVSLRPGFVLERRLNALYGDLRPFWLMDEDLVILNKKVLKQSYMELRPRNLSPIS